MATTNRRNLVLWVRLDGNGDVIPGSEQYRPRGVQPKDGNWRQAIGSYCCSCYCIITFLAYGGNWTITNIKTADGAIDWTDNFGTGGLKSFVIPSCYDQVFTLTFGTVTGTGAIVQASVLSGTGTILPISTYVAPGPAGSTVEISTGVPSTKCAEYLVNITDD